MSLATPILQSIKAFDKVNSQKFTFFIGSSSSQIVSNRLVIKKNDDNTIVYDQIQETFKYEHVLPANSNLILGQQYKANIYVRDINNNESQLSNTILFYCLSTPSLSFTNLGGNVINASSYEFQMSYSQSENEELENYQIYLYDINEILLAASPLKYDGLLKHTFSNLQDNTIYKIEGKCATANGMEATTGKVEFSVDYIVPQSSFAVTLENLNDKGCVKVSSSIVDLYGISSADPIYSDSSIDLKQSGTWVKFDEGFSLDGEFTLKIYGKNFTNYETILQALNKNDTNISPRRIVLKYVNNTIHVYKCFNDQVYYIYSETISPPLPDDLLCIWLQGKNNYLNVKLSNMGGG